MAFNLKPVTKVISKSFDLKLKNIQTCGKIIHPHKGSVYKTQKILWDTGATHSCLDMGIIKELDLKPIGGSGSKSKAFGGTFKNMEKYKDPRKN